MITIENVTKIYPGHRKTAPTVALKISHSTFMMESS